MKVPTQKILVVDDDQDAREYLVMCFEQMNYQVIQATNGQEALSLTKIEQPDVIVLDVVMPDLDGYQVCYQLKENKETSHIPIILITVLRKLEDEIRGFEAGAHDYISKPYNRAELAARITAAMRVKSLQDKLRYRNDSLKEIIKVLQRDITDPLTGVLGRTTLLLRHRLPEDVSEGLQTIENLAQKIAKLVKQLDQEIKDI
ncbi:MAG: response regulator [Blastocatellia bacterium]|nr:response regulator [Blastocatellia bacterium]MBN8721759.1 response regulator [Acidobacteriota bacterium]